MARNGTPGRALGRVRIAVARAMMAYARMGGTDPERETGFPEVSDEEMEAHRAAYEAILLDTPRDALSESERMLVMQLRAPEHRARQEEYRAKRLARQKWLYEQRIMQLPLDEVTDADSLVRMRLKRDASLRRQRELRKRREERQKLLARMTTSEALPTYETIVAADALVPMRAQFMALLEHRIAGATADIDQRREDLATFQRQVRTRDAEIADLEAAIAASDQEGSGITLIEVRDLIDELLALVNMPDVVGLRLNDDGEFVLEYQPRVTIHGVLYDIGDWEITFGSFERSQPHIYCIRSGATSQWRRRQLAKRKEWYYDYGPAPKGVLSEILSPYFYPGRKGWSSNPFCLDTRKETVIDFMRRGMFLEAIATTLEAVRSIRGYMSTTDSDIPQYFNSLGSMEPDPNQPATTPA